MQSQSPFRKWMQVISLGYMGGTIFILMYIRYVFYEQMLESMSINNAQMGMLGTVVSIINFIVLIPGAYLADKLDAKKVIVFSIGSITVLTFVFVVFITSYTMALVIWALQAIVLMSYWPCLVKYINNLGSKDEAGSSFGKYYLVNGLAGALGNALPLWASMKFDGFRSAIICVGIITLIATILVAIFLDDEKTLAERGIKLKGDEPIQLKHIGYVLKWPGTYIMGFAYATTYAIYSNVSYFNPYLIDVIGINPDASSAYSIIRSYGAMLVAPLGGYMADKVFKSTSKWFMVAFAISGVMFAIPFCFGPNSNPTLVSIYSVLPSIVVFSLYSVTFSILRELHIPATIVGTAVGTSQIFMMIVAGALPPLFGTLIDKFGNQGYTYIFIILIADCVLGILNAMWARSHNKKCESGERTIDLSGLAE